MEASHNFTHTFLFTSLRMFVFTIQLTSATSCINMSNFSSSFAYTEGLRQTRCIDIFPLSLNMSVAGVCIIVINKWHPLCQHMLEAKPSCEMSRRLIFPLSYWKWNNKYGQIIYSPVNVIPQVYILPQMCHTESEGLVSKWYMSTQVRICSAFFPCLTT